MKGSNRSVLWMSLAGLAFAGCPGEPHRGSAPRPTLDPGQCWPEPLTPVHSQSDGCDPKGERDPEPNGQLAWAVVLENSGIDGSPFTGNLGSSDDVDIFVVPTFTLPFTSIDPTSRTTKRTGLSFSADPNSRMCAFFSCTTGVTSREDSTQGCDGAPDPAPPVDADGSPGVFPSHLQEGMLGCCRVGSGTLIVGIDCDNTEPALNGFVTVESVGDGACNQGYLVVMSLVD